jgi:hypothetical protein
VVQFADTVFLPLLQTVLCRQSFPLGFNDSQGNRFALFNQRAAENIIRSAGRASARLAIHNVNLRSGFFDPDIRTPPASRFQRRVYQIKSCLGFVANHWLNSRLTDQSMSAKPLIVKRQIQGPFCLAILTQTV